jgi:hypothetical protein
LAKVVFNGEVLIPKKENRIKQGDYIYCNGNSGAGSFWGIYNSIKGTVVALDGAGDSYIEGKEIYLNETYRHWTIAKRIMCDKAKITIEEI